MKLVEFFNTKEGKRMKKGAFCDEIDITYQTLSNLLAGEYLPNLKTAIAIEKFTEGKVSVYDWLITEEDENAYKVKKRNTKKKEPDQQITE